MVTYSSIPFAPPCVHHLAIFSSPRHSFPMFVPFFSLLHTVLADTGPETQSLQAHPHAEVLSLDCNKYTPLTIHTSSNDRTIKTFDLRSPTLPLSTLQGHTLAVRKIATSP